VIEKQLKQLRAAQDARDCPLIKACIIYLLTNRFQDARQQLSLAYPDSTLDNIMDQQLVAEASFFGAGSQTLISYAREIVHDPIYELYTRVCKEPNPLQSLQTIESEENSFINVIEASVRYTANNLRVRSSEGWDHKCAGLVLSMMIDLMKCAYYYAWRQEFTKKRE